ncbi:NTP transferase domain-containing protein [Kribbella sp. NPDC026611]|uniref:phosphocholine cytidylyltransferase family protein n=1 Tax=Kribbella sp. NPDC026611 TaxID=3154911 RepID=UPI0033CEB040
MTAEIRPGTDVVVPNDELRAIAVQVVILAAGLGSRLGRSLPKPLTCLRDGRTILQRQLDCLRDAFGDDVDVTLVVGHQAGLVMPAAPGTKFVQNPEYRQTNTAKSLLLGLRASAPGGVLWLNGDVVFHPRLLDLVVPAVQADRSFVCVNTAAVAEEEIKYTVDADGHIVQLSKTVQGGLGEAIGINYVAAADKPVLIAHLAACADDDYFERGIETAIEHAALEVLPLDISAYPAVEVDFESDLARANALCSGSADHA